MQMSQALSKHHWYSCYRGATSWKYSHRLGILSLKHVNNNQKKRKNTPKIKIIRQVLFFKYAFSYYLKNVVNMMKCALQLLKLFPIYACSFNLQHIVVFLGILATGKKIYLRNFIICYRQISYWKHKPVFFYRC